MDDKTVVLGENKKNSKYGYLLYLAVLISFIIHLCFVAFSFRYSFQKHAKAFLGAITQVLNPEEKKQWHQKRVEKQQKVLQALGALRTTKRVAKLTPGKSNFGWTIFDHEPTKVTYDTKPEIPTTIEGSVGKALTVVATEQKPKITKASTAPKLAPNVQQAHVAQTEKPEILPAQEVKAMPVIKACHDEALVNPEIAIKPQDDTHEKDIWGELEKEMESIKQEERKKTVQKSKEPENASTQQRIKKYLAMQKKLEAFSGSGDSVEATKELLAAVWATPEGADVGIESVQSPVAPASVGQDQNAGVVMAQARGARSISGTKKRNIIALTRGYVENVKDLGGKDSLERDGDSSISPTLEELKYLSYETKLSWCLQASWKQNFAYNRFDRAMEGDAVIEFTVDQHGTLLNSKLLRPTGIVKLDSMIMKTTELAAPFPPLPKFFGTPTYTTGRIIQVRSSCARF